MVAQNSNAPHTPPTPATIAQRQVNALTTRLGLSSTQQAEALPIFTTAATTDAGLQPQLRTSRQSLKTAIETNNSAAISTVSAEIGSLTAQIAAADATAEAAFYLILTPAQQTTFNQAPGLGGPGFGGGPEFRGRR